MFDAPVDAWYAWIGLAAAATVTLGIAAGLPSAPPPDAAAVARTVDAVASAESPSSARHRLAADAALVTTAGISLRSDGGAAHARFRADSVVPLSGGASPPPDDSLAAVALGEPPGSAFDSPSELAAAVDAAREAGPVEVGRAAEPSGRDAESTADATPNRSVGRTVHVRHVSWGETDVTLVLLA
ncbi:hypothetical protein Hbl1158_07380 [Halobaculum sp. CBA1158]|uniref:DUF7283 family protein n=1 Tax=Halobaculum sp. CBA1158 TaxID=2904243 RepID=UPI001F1A9719|nr:hypothetical protein [Halobaculum sp. CBA1158]UIP01160.1 hypothetical protein Hbl1158_07380 [Halobaculum sp. CBA1158]